MRQPQKAKILARGFTLIELLVVVIILAILAAIVVPQFSNASSDTQEAALDANLSGMRNAIELYKLQHSAFPGGVATNGGSGCASPAAKGTATAAGEQAFKDHLLMYSDAAGNTCSVGDTTYRFGPYLKKAIPADPVKQISAVVVTTDGSGPKATADTGGWAYDSKTGVIVMNSNKPDSRGNAFSTH